MGRGMRLLCAGALLACLAGCRTETVSQAFLDAFRSYRPEQAPLQLSTDLDPKFRYLRVQKGRRDMFVALGYVDQSPAGPIEVWYSPKYEVLRLSDGRLVGASLGMGTDWRSVSFKELPRWNEIGEQAVFERQRDVSPGYRFGVREKMRIRRIAAPADSNLKLLSVSSLAWFEEQALDGDLPPTRYGVDMSGAKPQVVYAEQCLSDIECFSWQRWPPRKAGRQ